MGYFNLVAGLLSSFLAVASLAKPEGTPQFPLFWNAIFAGFNLFFAFSYFGWL